MEIKYNLLSKFIRGQCPLKDFEQVSLYSSLIFHFCPTMQSRLVHMHMQAFLHGVSSQCKHKKELSPEQNSHPQHNSPPPPPPPQQNSPPQQKLINLP